MRTNIVLIGMMGTSKSTCGKLLADELELLFLDVDALIEYEEMPIPELFSKFGEEYFRDIESNKIKRISCYENLVIATGGGVVKREENMRLLADSSYIVLLTCDSRTILSRVKAQRGTRPLLARPKLAEIERLQREREPLYRKWADVEVDTTHLTPAETVEQIRTKLLGYIDSSRVTNGEIEEEKQI